MHNERRKKLEVTRPGLTRRVDACGFTYYLTVNFFVDEKPAEIFITIAKEGSAISGFIEAFAITVSIALQYGVPWNILHHKYLNQVFEPRDDANSSLIHSIGVNVDELVKVYKDMDTINGVIKQKE